VGEEHLLAEHTNMFTIEYVLSTYHISSVSSAQPPIYMKKNVVINFGPPTTEVSYNMFAVLLTIK